MRLITLLILISSISFLGYGIGCLTSEKMKLDFKRYGSDKLRVLTGILEILGGAGLLVGTQNNLILIISSGGLALLMLIAFIIRVKIKDSVAQSLPAFVLMLVNFDILLAALNLFGLRV